MNKGGFAHLYVDHHFDTPFQKDKRPTNQAGIIKIKIKKERNMQYYDTDPHALSCAPHEKLY